MKLSDWAKSKGVSYQAALKWIKLGKFPDRYEKMPTGTIIVYPDERVNDNNKRRVVLYARVSSHDQKDDLARQMLRLRDFAAARGYDVADEVAEISSGLNDKRRGLLKILSDKSCPDIVVEHKDRLSRFGVGMIEASLSVNSRSVIVMNETEDKTELVQDFVDVVTSLCARIYGQRGAAHRAKRALESAADKVL